MKVAPLYRSVLKQLRRACRCQPHFVCELRFLLSLPVDFDGPTSLSSTPSRAGTQPVRPITEGWQPDLSPDELFVLCREDLRQAIDNHSLGNAPMSAESVGRQVTGFRELTWLQQRLQATLSDATQAALDLAISVSAGPGDDDFIPDTAFAKAEVDRQTRHLLGEAIPSAESEKLNQFQFEATPGGTYAMVDEKPSPRGASDEHDVDRLYSAGAVGLHREMFVLRHRDTAFLPMRAYFLRGLDSPRAVSVTASADHGTGGTSVSTIEHSPAPSRTSAPAVGSVPSVSQAKVAELVVHHVPIVRSAHNEEVKLTVTVRPFDEAYTNRSQAGIGYFEGAHRQFLVHFRLEALGHQQAIRVVNTQFMRLDMVLSELIEETGLLHSSDVKEMIQERDAAVGIVSQVTPTTVNDDEVPQVALQEMTSAVAEAGEAAPGELRLSDVHVANDESVRATEDAGHGAVSPAAREFALAFVTESDGPSVMKGILYYQAAVTEEALVATPVHAITFSHVLMNP